MAGASGAEERAWVLRVLGYDIGAAGGQAPKSDLIGLWRSAKEGVDARLAALQKALEADEDPDFARLAKTSLFDLGTNENVTLMTSLMSYQKAAGDEQAGAASALREAVDRYRSMLESSPIPGILDDNPFGVDVGFRETLGSALHQIQAATR